MTARSTPQSSINNILDFLMFFNSGKTCPVTHEFIANKITGTNEQVKRRYDDFYIVTAFISSEADWDQTSLGDLLSQMDDLEKNYTHAGLKHKWFVTKLDIIFQIGLSILREMINLEGDALPEDPADFVIPSQISVAAYRNKIEALLEKHKSYYIEEETGDLHVKYPHHLEALVAGVVDEENATGKSKRGAKKAVLNGRKVYELLEEHRLAVFTQSIVKFIQSVEEKVLPIPLDVGCYAGGAGESLSNTLRRLSNQHHQRDWTDAEAEAHGPYAQNGESSSARKPRAGSEHEAAASSSRSKITGSATKHAPMSPVFTQSAPASPAHTAPTAKRGRRGANAKSKNAEVEEEEEEEVVEAGTVTAVSQQFKRKYEVSDPLLDCLGGETTSPAKARARVSREAELPPASTSKQQSSGNKATTTRAATSSKTGASAQGKKNLFQGGVHKKGEKVEFSDSEEVDSVYEEESDVSSDEGRGTAKGPVAQLLSLKGSHPKVNGKFPAKLDSPTKNTKNAKKLSSSSNANSHKKVDKVALSAQSNAIIASGQRQKWNFEQETILAEAVGRYGEGNWKDILNDPEYAEVFVGRTNVNLKDKWRNMQKAAFK